MQGDIAATYVLGHVGQTARPVGGGEVLVSPPRVAVKGVAAPAGPGHVVVEEDVDLLLRALCRDRVEDLEGTVSRAAAS